MEEIRLHVLDRIAASTVGLVENTKSLMAGFNIAENRALAAAISYYLFGQVYLEKKT